MPSALRRYVLLALALAGCALLAVAEFTELYSVRVITVTVAETAVGEHHRYALLVIAPVAAAMAVGATRGGSRPAAVALLVLAAAALAVVLAVDLPAVDEEGLYGRDFEQAHARAEIGFFLSTGGAVLLLASAASILLFAPAGQGRRLRRDGSAPASPVGDGA